MLIIIVRANTNVSSFAVESIWQSQIKAIQQWQQHTRIGKPWKVRVCVLCVYEKEKEREREQKREREYKLVQRLDQAFKFTHADKEDQFKFVPTKTMKQECVQFDDTKIYITNTVIQHIYIYSHKHNQTKLCRAKNSTNSMLQSNPKNCKSCRALQVWINFCSPLPSCLSLYLPLFPLSLSFLPLRLNFCWCMYKYKRLVLLRSTNTFVIIII